MSVSLLDAVMAYFTAGLTRQAATYFGESHAAIKKSVVIAGPIAMAGIINMADHSPEALLNMSRNAHETGILTKLESFFREGGQGRPAIGPSMISNIFGDDYERIAKAVSDYTLIKSSTLFNLFGTILPLSLAVIGKHATEVKTTPAALAAWLGSMKTGVQDAIPAELQLEGLPGYGTNSKSGPPKTALVVEKNGTSWVWPSILVLVSVILVMWLFKTCNKP